NTCNNDKILSKIQLEHEKEDELVMVVVKVAHELDYRMVVKEIKDGLLEEMEVSHFGKEVMILEWMSCASILVLPTFLVLENFGWWFKQDINGESEDDNKKKFVTPRQGRNVRRDKKRNHHNTLASIYRN
ncbi:hypothetical protein Tco_1440463, partial [Tanacetum coccineum]